MTPTQFPLSSRDLKPANILIQLRSAAAVASVPQWKTVPIHNLIFKVGDFGLSRFIPDDLTSMTDVGTPRYWAPEVHTKHYDKAVDIYSIGVIAFRLICGRVPAQHEGDYQFKKTALGAFQQQGAFAHF